MWETEQRNFPEMTQESNRDKMGSRVFFPFYFYLAPSRKFHKFLVTQESKGCLHCFKFLKCRFTLACLLHTSLPLLMGCHSPHGES